MLLPKPSTARLETTREGGISRMGVSRLTIVAALIVAAAGVGAATWLESGALSPTPAAIPPTLTATTPPSGICDSRVLAGPSTPPDGAVIVRPGDDLADLTSSRSPGTTFWLAAGTHTLPGGAYGQVIPKDGNTYVGAPGAVLDGQGTNRYAFTQQATNVTIEHLTIQGFEAPNNEGVVNHDSGNDWLIRYNTIQDNEGAGTMIGDGNVIEYNCLRDNGQYGFNAYEPDGVVDVILRGNEITGNNTGDWERRSPGCGCTGGGKFWNTIGAQVTGNYIHRNLSVGLWADGNNSDFVIEGNYIADNAAEGIFYEQSYNARIVDNVLVGNAIVKGPMNPGFPAGAIYISEAGGDARAPGGQPRLEIAGNLFENNWSGVILWENADRFSGSPANTSTGLTTMVNPDATIQACSTPSIIRSDPYYDDCRWKTQNVLVRDNDFKLDPASVPGCQVGQNGCGLNGVFSNWGTFPSWSPYTGDVVQQAITFEQGNEFRSNHYTGPWAFMAFDQGSVLTWKEWTGSPLTQDRESTLAGRALPGSGKSPAEAPRASESAFSDVQSGNPFFTEITGLHEQGITIAYPEGTYRPTTAVDRETVAAFLHRIASGPVPAKTASATDTGPTDASFPVAASERRLLDESGRAWFAVGDAPWSLIGQLTDEEITAYLEDRADKGFRLVMFSAPELHYADHAPRNRDNVAPFMGAPFQSDLNDGYWARVDHAVDEAARLGLTALITPAYLGCCNDGVLPELTNASIDDVYAYGVALGERYGGKPNIMWLAGHDTSPTTAQADRYAALQQGVKAAGDTHLWMPGGQNNDIGSNNWGAGSEYFDIDTAYDYAFTPVAGVRSARNATDLPVVYIEGSYENMRTGDPSGTTSPWELRYQAWGSFAAGAVAHIYGNDPIWHFNSLPGRSDWRTEHLDDPGSVDMSHFARVLREHDWSGSAPDTDGIFLTDGRQSGRSEAAARLSPDRALVYMPNARAVSLNLSLLRGSNASITRIDPATGTSEVLTTSASGSYRVPPQGTHGDGSSDWVLLVEAN